MAGLRSKQKQDLAKRAAMQSITKAGVANAMPSSDGIQEASGFVGEYTGKSYTKKEAELLALISDEGIANAGEARPGTISQSILGVSSDVWQAFKDAGFVGDDNFAMDFIIMDERERRHKERNNVKSTPGITLPTAETAGQGIMLPTAKDTMGWVGGTEYGGITGEAASFRIGRTVENKPFVEIEEDILDGIPEEEWTKKVNENLRNKFPNGIAIGKDTIKINQKSRREMTFSAYMQWLRKNEPQAFSDKLRATNNADELVLAAENWVNEGAKHGRKDTISSFARGNVLMKVGGNNYSADVVVGIKNTGEALLYDVINLQPTTITENETNALNTEYPSPGVDRNNASVSNDSISQSAPNSQENTAGNIFDGHVLPTAKEQMEQAKREKRAAKAKTEVERTGILLGVPDKIIQAAKRISKVLGIEVCFYRNTGGKVKNDKGYYNRDGRKIYLNAEITDPVAFILGHEMIHHIQLTKSYLKFADTILKKILQDGGDLDAMRQELKERYAENGVKLDTMAEVDQDVIAEYAQEHLFTDEASIISVVNADKEGGSIIARFLDTVLAKFGDKDAQERAFVQRARSLYAKALRESNREGQANTYKSETVLAGGGEATKQAEGHVLPTTKDMMAQGDRTNTRATALDTMEDAEYDARMEVLEAERSMAGESMLYDDGRQFAIGGKKGIEKHNAKGYNNINKKEEGERYADTGKYDSVRETQLRTNEETGIYGRRNQKDATGNPSDTKGNQGTPLPLDRRENDGDIPKRGIIRSVFHGTPYRFKTFFKSYIDIGIHFGTKAQAEARLSNENGHVDEFDLRLDNPLVIKDIFGEKMAEQYAAAVLRDSKLSEDEKKVFEKEFRDFLNTDIKVMAADSLEKKILEGRHRINTEIRANGIYVTLALVDDNSNINEIPMAELIDKNKLVEILGFEDTVRALKEGNLPETAREKLNPYILEAILPFEKQYLQLRKIEGILQSFGYDGFAYKNKNEGEGWSYAVFDDSQIIRKTDKKDDGVTGRQYAIAKEPEDRRIDELPKKAQTALRQTESRLSERIGEILGVPRRAQRDFLQGIIRDISEDCLQSGMIDRTKADALFEEAYKQGVVVDAEYFERYKHIRDHLRNTQLTISEEDRSSIADFDAFRKSAFGKLRIVNEGGLPVDVAYEELEDMAPELFPEDITHPADQLQHMFEIADGIRKTEQTLNEAYGEEAETFKAAAKDEFHAALNSAAVDFKRVKRYAESRSRLFEEQEAEKKGSIQSREELDEAYKNLKTARRNLEKVKRSVLLTEQDEMRVGQLLRGEISPVMLNPEQDNVKDIIAVYRAKQEYENYARRIRDWNAKRKEGLRAQAREYLANIQKWKDKVHFGGLRYSRETMERNFRDIMGEDAEGLIAEYLTPVHKAQADIIYRFITKNRNAIAFPAKIMYTIMR